jgi:hypothetical protein
VASLKGDEVFPILSAENLVAREEAKAQAQHNKEQFQGGFSVPTLDHPSDEDLSLGTPMPQEKNAARVGHPKSFEQMQQVSLRYAEIAS